MLVERKNNEIIVTLDGAVNVDFLQQTLDYLRYLELGAKSKASQAQINQLAQDAKKGWWEKNRDKFIK
ncbi:MULTISPECIES: hypothetical protein [unclassified Imperialibacter]|uniref:hypothetical protein n=1 Tax=unclassified Imperialibacter TaxID=2629706 RepID=UPI001257295F|nr:MULTISPECIES: hypothetical protein [unclassified Imperialibacter]CAD5258111.1 conserved hypothetical protein [Imperialibacter sp. 75]CAD5261166.1 conserved hypothetical protein [Imperialibacter sp. 89]VVT25010.1 conserved hypothetical protein [Imperialibacter sp. EC-SDR9]